MTRTPPVYQDINKLSCKSNELVDSEQCTYKDAHGLSNDNVGSVKSDHQKVKLPFASVSRTLIICLCVCARVCMCVCLK